MAENKNNQNIKNILANIKSKLIFRKIFCNILEKKLLNIIRFNKNFQNKLNKNIIDYKKIYLKIEIEIIPHKYSYGKFINIDKDNRQYYHIYFNDKKKEINKRYFETNEKVNKIRITIDYEIKSFINLFSYCKCVKKINFIKFNRSNIVDMSGMFSDCESLEYLNLINFKTDKVTDMSSMFENCKSIKKLNLINFNTNRVENMSNMFRGCTSLCELNITNFNTNNVSNMNSMFQRCMSLREIKCNEFNTNKVTDMKYMFYFCYSLKELMLNGFDANNVRDMSFMFVACHSLKELNLNISTNNTNINMESMFFDCSKELINKIKKSNSDIKSEAFYSIDNFCYW